MLSNEARDSQRRCCARSEQHYLFARKTKEYQKTQHVLQKCHQITLTTPSASVGCVSLFFPFSPSLSLSLCASISKKHISEETMIADAAENVMRLRCHGRTILSDGKLYEWWYEGTSQTYVKARRTCEIHIDYIYFVLQLLNRGLKVSFDITYSTSSAGFDQG